VGDVKSRDYRNTDFFFSGLILMGAYPANSNSLNSSRIPVLSIYGEFDGLATTQKIDEKRLLLPPSTRFFAIAGGNHAQFGSYGPQKDDGVAAISPQDQWEIVGNAVADFIHGTGGLSQ
jgi:pimeloyl-ACP methyl ester carboxylesterase